MKKIGLILVLFTIFTACKTQNNKQDGVKQETVVDVDTDISQINEIVSQDKFKNLLATAKDYQLVDVRTPKETAKGKINDTAIEIDYFSDNFEEQLATLDKNKPVLVYCEGGYRSGEAAQIMNKLGFKIVYDLEGGYGEWK